MEDNVEVDKIESQVTVQEAIFHMTDGDELGYESKNADGGEQTNWRKYLEVKLDSDQDGNEREGQVIYN